MHDQVAADHRQARMRAVEAHVLGAVGVDDHVAGDERSSGDRRAAAGLAWISARARSTEGFARVGRTRDGDGGGEHHPKQTGRPIMEGKLPLRYEDKRSGRLEQGLRTGTAPGSGGAGRIVLFRAGAFRA